jgi:hypothetical protein
MTARLENLLTRAAEQFKSTSTFFPLHLDLSLNNSSELIEVLNSLITNIYPKLIVESIRQYGTWDKTIPDEGYRLFKLDNTSNSPTQNFTENVADVKAILFLDKVVPKTAPQEIRARFIQYYTQLEKLYKQVSHIELPYLASAPPKILINLSNQKLLDTISQGIAFSWSDVGNKAPTHFRYERFPIVLLNTSQTRTSSEIENCALVVNVLPWEDNFSVRGTVKSFTQNQISNFLESALGLIVITFNEKMNLSLKHAEKLNHHFFHTELEGSSEHKILYSVFHRKDNFDRVPNITWIDDLQVGVLYDELVELAELSLREKPAEWFLIRLLSHVALASAIPFLTNEILHARNGVNPDWKGLLSTDISTNLRLEIESKLAQLQSRILMAMKNRSIVPDRYHQIIVSDYLLQTKAFIDILPNAYQAKLASWKRIRYDAGKTLILDFPAPKPALTSFLHFHRELKNYDMPLINRGYPTLADKIQLNAWKEELESLDSGIYVRIEPILSFEKDRRSELATRFSGVRSQESQLFDAYLSKPNRQSELRKCKLYFMNSCEIATETQRYLVKPKCENWKVLPVSAVTELFSSDSLDSIVARKNVDALFSPEPGDLPYDWRGALIKKVQEIGPDKAYEILTKKSREYGLDMVSWNWFQTDWLNSTLKISSPSRKLRLLIIGEFAGIPRAQLAKIHHRKIADQLAHSDRNRKLLDIICRYLNLNLEKDFDHTRLASKYMSDDKFAIDLALLKDIFQYTPEEWSPTELQADIYKLLFACRTKIAITKLTAISAS